MSDAPLQGVPVNNASGLSPKVDPRDVADIDRELEAYLREKQLGRPLSLNDSVDTQLSRIKEKVSNRPPKKEVETEIPSVPVKLTPPVASPGSHDSRHEDLIRSLEEKYSAGQKEVLPNKKEALRPSAPIIEVASTVNVPSSEPESAPVERVRRETAGETQGVPGIEKITPSQASLLDDLAESIESEDRDGVAELLSLAEKLSADEQESLVTAFLPRFRRNKERKELYVKTQTELESEMRSFINNRMKRTAINAEGDLSARTPTAESASNKPEASAVESAGAVEKRAVEESRPEQTSAPVQPKPFEVLEDQASFRSQPEPERTTPVAPSVPSAISGSVEAKPVAVKTEEPTLNVAQAPSPVEAMSGDAQIIERYKQYLSSLERKPTVLLYDPSQGFVRKAIDPNDSTLTLSYAVDSSTQAVVLQIFDANGAMLSEIRTPIGEF